MADVGEDFLEELLQGAAFNPAPLPPNPVLACNKPKVKKENAGITGGVRGPQPAHSCFMRGAAHIPSAESGLPALTKARQRQAVLA